MSIGGSIPSSWLPRYSQLLAEGDTRGAFATLVCGAGFAPAAMTRMPPWLVTGLLRLGIRGEKWIELESLLATNLAEHGEVVKLDDGTVDRYRLIGARVLLLGGTKSPSFITSEPFAQLERINPKITSELIEGLDHTAPEKAPDVIAERIWERCIARVRTRRPRFRL